MKRVRAEMEAPGQYGLMSRKQLLAGGASYHPIARRVARGDYVEVFPGVYRVKGAPESQRQRLLAAIFATGHRAVASHRSAAAILGFRGFHLDTVEITVGPSYHPRLGGAVVHRSAYLTDEDALIVGGIPTTTAARTLFDLGALLSARALHRVIADALTDRLVTLARLLKEVEKGVSGRPGSASFRKALALLDDQFDYGESWLEDSAIETIHASGFVLPERQVEVRSEEVFIGRVDLAYPGLKLAIEADGYEFHSTRLDFIRDRQRQNDLVMAGWSVLRYTSEDARHPAHFRRCLASIGVPLLSDQISASQVHSGRFSGNGYLRGREWMTF